MEAQDETLISRLIEHNPELKQLMDTHRKFESQLDEMNNRPYLTSEDDLERKRIQKAKLAGKDKIERILAQHRGQ
ncbi:MAG: DUF465 domain-containing protein [Deltaproteobacteria bacterium]|jgi:uncharacterized protein YdcH (DUF465 family)|nr:DUF465 domain-containing protein [Deltaproteobacteria bacterium]